MLSAKKELFTPSGGGYQISRSVRLRSSASAYLSRTLGTATNNKIWTWSGWIKRGKPGGSSASGMHLFGTGSASTDAASTQIQFDGENLLLTGYATNWLKSNAVYRDPSAWYHIVVTWDNSNATVANRAKMYVNGVEVSYSIDNRASLSTSSTYGINQAVLHTIGAWSWNNGTFAQPEYYDGYLTEINFIDGQALTPSSFGETNALTGVWQPKRYIGTYGTNGFYLNFSDNSATDALGYDFSTGLYSKNLRTSGTNIGTFTANGGLTAAFDGNFNQPNATSAKATAPAAGYNTAVIGKDWGADVTKTITAVQLFSQNDGGFVGGTTTALVFKLQGSNDNSTWTDLTSPITGPATGANTIITVTSGITTSTAYRYHRINVNADGTNNYYMCELAFYEAGSYNLNNWFPNNISLTAGVTYDSMLDVPTLYADGGNGRGNYSVMNPLAQEVAGVVIDGNLRLNNTAASNGNSRSTIAFPSSGLWYVEGTVGSTTSASVAIGFGIILASVPVAGGLSGYNTANTWSIYASNISNLNNNGSVVGSGGVFTAGDVLQVAVDRNNNRIWIGKNNTWYNSTYGTTGDPSTGANPTFTSVTANDITLFAMAFANSFAINFGQRSFTYTPPTGFKALNTQNLPTPTISNGATVMAATLYTGTNANLTVTNTVSGVSMQPDLVWMKRRSSISSHVLIDSVRGVTKTINSDSTVAESTSSGTSGLLSFNSNGFSLGTDTTANGSTNGSGQTYVGWQWQAGAGSSSSNTSGTITSTVSAGATQGFSVVTYTGTGANATVGHGLGVAPSMIIVKNRSSGTTDWAVYHKNLTSAAYYLWLNSTQAQATSAIVWNSTTPTSSVFSIGTGSQTNGSTNSMVAYCFAEVAGYSKFGSYTGNGSTDGPFVYTGFRPRWIMIKRTDSISNWSIRDTSRDVANTATTGLHANLSDAESTQAAIDILSNGFKCRDAGGAATNTSGGTYIYAAFAENPFKYSLAR